MTEDIRESLELLREAQSRALLSMPVDLGGTCGNSFLLVHHRPGELPPRQDDLRFWQEIARLACHRAPRVDDTLHVSPGSVQGEVEFLVIGGDGVVVSHCGNGLLYAASRLPAPRARFNCSGALHDAFFSEDSWRLDLGAPADLPFSGARPCWLKAPPHVIDTGEPHAVTFAEDVAPNSLTFEEQGREICALYDPGGINWTLVRMLPGGLFVRTFERGVRRSTTSCGTGAAAAFQAARARGAVREDSCEVTSPGGAHTVGAAGKAIWISATPEHRRSLTLGELLSGL